MTIEKLPSGSYRIKKMINGKRYSVTVDYKPNKYEAEELIHEKIYGNNKLQPVASVGELAENYILKCKKENKSPSTIGAYQSMIRNTPDWFLRIKIKDITAAGWQRMIDEYSQNHSAKSVHNINGFYNCVFGDISNLKYATIKLPKKTKKAEYEPSTQDIMDIMDYIKGSKYECGLKLACLGLRRGEIVAITDKDIDKFNVLTINKDAVFDSEVKRFVIKDHPKTEASNRRIKIPDELADLIRAQGKAFDGFPNSLNRYLQRVQEKLGIPKFRLHMLRHYAAAYLHKNGFSDKQIMAFMGWETIGTMHQVYNYNLDPEESQKEISDVFNKLY